MCRKHRTKTQEKQNNRFEINGDVTFQLSTKRSVTVRKGKTRKFVDIRELYDDSGMTKPVKKGISLSVDQWKKL
ncbi:hypothetical protein PsorP6_001027 [Peronosclerospora sorghi]|uniref:Uncharacterized protein n=1 Tax=Peronosclerospora sorghi TaxID=230839 RepID=A0ACC0WTI0_9STRA|nr:hypothetical protein PsorP6_001027 [Peronosclerospora sorghi]